MQGERSRSDNWGYFVGHCGGLRLRRGDADVVCGCDNQVSALNGRFCAVPCNINGQRDVATPDADCRQQQQQLNLMWQATPHCPAHSISWQEVLNYAHSKVDKSLVPRERCLL